MGKANWDGKAREVGEFVMTTKNSSDGEAALATVSIPAETASQELRSPTSGAISAINLSENNRISPAQLGDIKRTTSVSHEDFIGLYQIYWGKVVHDDSHANSRAERGMLFQGFLLTAYTFLFQVTQQPQSYDALKLWIPRIGLIACLYTMVGISLSIRATYRLGTRMRGPRFVESLAKG